MFLEILLEPGHCRTVATILDKTGVSVRSPGSTVDVAPEGNARDLRRFPECGDLLGVALFLLVVVIRTDIVFGNEERHRFALGILDAILDLVQGALEIVGVHVGQVMSLLTVRIDRSPLLDELVHEVDTFVNLPPERVIVIIDKDSLRPTFARHLECSRHEFVVAVIATESRNNIIVSAINGMVAATRLDGFIHHVDHFEIGVMGGNGVEPCGNRLLGFVRAKAIEPVRVLGAPHKSVELELATILFCPVIASIAARPIVTTARAFDGRPLAFVFGGNLVPVSPEIGLNLATSCNVS